VAEKKTWGEIDGAQGKKPEAGVAALKTQQGGGKKKMERLLESEDSV